MTTEMDREYQFEFPGTEQAIKVTVQANRVFRDRLKIGSLIKTDAGWAVDGMPTDLVFCTRKSAAWAVCASSLLYEYNDKRAQLKREISEWATSLSKVHQKRELWEVYMKSYVANR